LSTFRNRLDLIRKSKGGSQEWQVIKNDFQAAEGYLFHWNPDLVVERLGRRGHLAFEVHDSHKSRERWAPGAACRWRKVRIQEL
jgi:hypothetical protein